MGQQLGSLTGHLRELVNTIWLCLFNRISTYFEKVFGICLAVTTGMAALAFLYVDTHVDYITFKMIIGVILTALAFVIGINGFRTFFQGDGSELDSPGASRMVRSYPLRMYQGPHPGSPVEQQRSKTTDIQSTGVTSETSRRSDAEHELSSEVSLKRRESPSSPASFALVRMWNGLMRFIYMEARLLGLLSRSDTAARDEVKESKKDKYAERLKLGVNYNLTRSQREETRPLLGSRSIRYDMYAPSTSFQRTNIPTSVSGESGTVEKSKQSAEEAVKPSEGETCTSITASPLRRQQALSIPAAYQSPTRPPVERLLRSASEIAAAASSSPRKRPLSAVAGVKDQSLQLKRTKCTAPLARTESAESHEAEFSATESLEVPEKSAKESPASGESESDNSED